MITVNIVEANGGNKLAKKHRTRLNDLIALLETIPRSRFSMGNYLCTKNFGEIEDSILRLDELVEAHQSCNTVGCVVGHSLSLFRSKWKLEIPTKHWSDECIDYSRVAQKAFGIINPSSLWDFLFSGVWSSNDVTNTPQAAVDRIQYVLETDLVPCDIDEWTEFYESYVKEE